MAVTQQLARMSFERVIQCRGNPDELERIISYDYAPPEEDIDLNWAPKALIGGVKAVGEESTAHLLDLLFCGEEAPIVDPERPDGPGPYDVYSPITYMTPDSVAQLAAVLRRLDAEEIAAAATRSLGKEAEEMRSPDLFHLKTFNDFRSFLNGATLEGQAVVSWWD